jgi:tetratricopeptide (TPR) repeat protein
MVFSPLAQTPLRNVLTRSVLASLLIFFSCAATALAQVGGIDPDPGDPGTGGRNSIQGSIFLAGGRHIDRRAKVKLTGLTGGEQFQMSDDNGQFTFRRLHGGTYTVVVDAGSEFEIAAENVDIIEAPRRRGEQGVTVSVYFTLQPRSSETRVPGTVSAAHPTIPDAALQLYKEAIESAKVGDRKKAIDQLHEALKIYPDFAVALNELGVQYIGLKQWDKAVDALQNAIKLAPEAFPPRLNCGIALVHKRDFVAAANQLTFAIRRDDSSTSAHYYLGRALVNLGNYDAAEKELQKVIRPGRDDESIEAHRYLAAVYIEKKNATRAAEELETYLKLAPAVADAEKIRNLIKDLRTQASTKSK